MQETNKGILIRVKIKESDFDYYWETEFYKWLTENTKGQWEAYYWPDAYFNSRGDRKFFENCKMVVIFKEMEDATMCKLRWSN